jgi:hypothetical protein
MPRAFEYLIACVILTAVFVTAVVVEVYHVTDNLPQ